MLYFRPISDSDLPFLLDNERRSCERDGIVWEGAEREAFVGSFLHDARKFGFIALVDQEYAGLILCREHWMSDTELPQGWRTVLVPHLGPGDGIVHPYDLWVNERYRRQGIATMLKARMDAKALARGLEWVFTFQHPENPVAIAMNRKLGYRELGRACFWDEVERICFLKRLD